MEKGNLWARFNMMGGAPSHYFTAPQEMEGDDPLGNMNIYSKFLRSLASRCRDNVWWTKVLNEQKVKQINCHHGLEICTGQNHTHRLYPHLSDSTWLNLSQ